MATAGTTLTRARADRLLAHSTELVAVLEADGRLALVAPWSTALAGWPEHAAEERRLPTMCATPTDERRASAWLAGLAASGPAEPASVVLRLRDGDDERVCELIGWSRFDDPLIGGILVHGRDVTDAVDVEARAVAAVTHLSTHSSILAMAGDAIFTVRSSGMVQDFNRAAADIFGWAPEQIIGKRFTLLFDERVVADLSARTNAWTQSLMDPVETEAIRRGGVRFPALVAVSRVDVNGATLFTAVVRDLGERRAIEERLEFVTLHDELTQLPNRRLLLQRVDEAVRRPKRAGHLVAVAYLDLVDFQAINDEMGLLAGDRVLRLAADRIRAVAGGAATVARLGGDEFAILIDGASVEAISDVAVRVGDALARPFDIDGQLVEVGARIGIAVSGDGEADALDLVRHAELAMNRCKERGGRGCVELYDEGMQRRMSRRRELQAALRGAVARDEVRAFYQPIIAVGHASVVRYEALMRWERPGIGLLLPCEFIPLAEESALIIELGAWMLRTATTDCAGWQETHPGVGVTVNVSARHLDEGDIVADVRRALDESQLPPALLTLEITESVMLADTARTLSLLLDLQAWGISIVLDDFGTGYSSLTYLRSLPIDGLKIDKSFIDTIGTDDEDTTILRAIIDIGAAYDLAVVGEGIDSPAKLALLDAIGCGYGQGYYFAEPRPLPEALDLG